MRSIGSGLGIEPRKMYGLDLFSGIGGIGEALEPWVQTIAYCEADRFAQSILLSRMSDGSLARAPIWDDVRTLKGSMFETKPEIIFGGFPCQDISTAGRGGGLDGERSGLFFDIARLVDELRPKFVFLENVPAITCRGLPVVCEEFAKLRYDCRWTIVSAKEVGAKHLRKRWFLLAHPISEQVRVSESGEEQRKEVHASSALGDGKDSNSFSEGGESLRRQIRDESEQPFGLGLLEGNDWDEYARFLLRMDHGLQYRSNRLKALGNSVVPLQARKAFLKLMGIK